MIDSDDRIYHFLKKINHKIIKNIFFGRRTEEGDIIRHTDDYVIKNGIKTHKYIPYINAYGNKIGKIKTSLDDPRTEVRCIF